MPWYHFLGDEYNFPKKFTVFSIKKVLFYGKYAGTC